MGRTWSRLILAGVLILAVAGYFALGWQQYFSWDNIRSKLDTFKAQAEDHWLAALAIYFLVYSAITALSIPVAAILTLLGGALFGRVVGTLLISVAATLGAVLAFFSSRYLL